jgi:hypothetical protein
MRAAARSAGASGGAGWAQQLVALSVGAADLDFAFGDKAFFRTAYEDARGRLGAVR